VETQWSALPRWVDIVEEIVEESSDQEEFKELPG
jgi:hypothetical protein